METESTGRDGELEGIWGGGDLVEWKLLRIHEVILMKTPRNGEYRVSTRHLLSPGKASSGGTKLHSTELWTKEVPWKSPNNSSCC